MTHALCDSTIVTMEATETRLRAHRDRLRAERNAWRDLAVELLTCTPEQLDVLRSLVTR